MKQVKVEDDALGLAIKGVMDSFGIKDYMMVSIDKNKAGATMFAVEESAVALTMMNLLFNAIPEVFSMFVVTMLGAHLELIRKAFGVTGEMKGEVTKQVSQPVDMNDYVKGVKF